MRKITKKIILSLLIGVMLITPTATPLKAEAATIYYDTNVTIVDSIDNVQYPKTETEYAFEDYVSSQYFSVSSQTVLKAYFSWDPNEVAKATVWFATDRDGVNVIGTKTSLTTPGQSIVTALDTGSYYLCYSIDSRLSDEYGAVNFALLGEKVATTETEISSSKAKPNILLLSTPLSKNINRGFLGATSPTDYYLFSTTEETNITFEYNFREYNGLDVKKATIKIYDYETDAIVASKTFSPSKANSNTLDISVPKGTYYITMSGATTSTTLTATITSTESSIAAGTTPGAGDREKVEPIEVTYVDYIDNYQYPETSKYTTVSGLVGVKSFELKKPTIIKIYMTWDTSVFKSANVWISRDESGYDIIKEESKLAKTTSYAYHLLDPGVYYINYEMSGTDTKANAGICVLGEVVNTSEGSNYASSYKKPITLTLNKTYKGFLSATAPVDYYKLTLDEKSMVTFTFDFTQLNGNKNSGAKITIYNSNNTMLKSQTYSPTDSSKNTISMLLSKGTYYISMTGAETSTILKAGTTSRTIGVNKTTSNDKVTISLNCSFNPTEVKVVYGYIYNDLTTDNNTWSKATTVEGLTYKATKNGYYTFRIKDAYGNYLLKRVNISSIR